MARVSGGAVPRFVQVRCPAGNRRRAGESFNSTFRIFGEGEVTAENLELLAKDPALEVQGSDDGETFKALTAIDLPEDDADSIGRPDANRDPLTGDLEQITEERDLAKLQVRQLGDQVDTLTGEASQLRSDVSSLSSQLATANGSLTTVTGERDEALEAHKRVTEQLELAQGKIVELEAAAAAPADQTPAKPTDAEQPAKAAKAPKAGKDQAKS